MLSFVQGEKMSSVAKKLDSFHQEVPGSVGDP